MTRVPLVRKLVNDLFGREPVAGVNPDEVVALGAAVHAAELSRQQGAALLIDVATHSLSVGVLGGGVRKLLAKNTAVPAVAKDIFLPSKSGQTEARMAVYQGESDYANECTKLGEVVLGDLHVERRGDVPIEVTFELSAEGMLSVRAVDTTTGMGEALRIDARTTLAPAEVDRLKDEQQRYASEQGEKDKQLAMTAFPRILDKAEKLARLLEKSAQENPGPEAEAVVGEVRALLAKGRAALKGADTPAMADVTRTLERLLSVV
jgi:molecular chaperone DnaK